MVKCQIWFHIVGCYIYSVSLLQKQHLTFLEFTVFYCHGSTVFRCKIYGHFLQCGHVSNCYYVLKAVWCNIFHQDGKKCQKESSCSPLNSYSARSLSLWLFVCGCETPLTSLLVSEKWKQTVNLSSNQLSVRDELWDSDFISLRCCWTRALLRLRLVTEAKVALIWPPDSC